MSVPLPLALRARFRTAVFHAIGNICEIYAPKECLNYFLAAGYASGEIRKALDSQRCCREAGRNSV